MGSASATSGPSLPEPPSRVFRSGEADLKGEAAAYLTFCEPTTTFYTLRTTTMLASTATRSTTTAAALLLSSRRSAASFAARRAFTASAAASSDPFDRPGPVPLPPKEQKEFEKLVREKANALQFKSAAQGNDESVHPDLRRKPAPDFEGEVNPQTGFSRRPSSILSQLLRAPDIGFPGVQLRAFSTTAAFFAEGSDESRRGRLTSGAEGSKDQPPSISSDPFPLPFDPSLTSSSIEGSPPPVDLASSSQIDGLPTFTFPEHAEEFASSSNEEEGGAINREIYSPMTRVPGRTPLTEDRERTIARLVYQVRKRGTLETDLLLSTFAKTELKGLSDDDLLEFDQLLDEPDWDIFYWSTDRKPVPERWAASFATEGRLGWRLRKHTRNEEKVPRRMPNLE
ncbi:hypothetical protein CF327_g5100 [Tilletia walkeri]|nr:hypothetical protein CF327_g5100 [Tilletia walkeri]